MNKLQTRKTLPVDKARRLMELQALMKELKIEADELKADLLKTTQQLDVYTLKTGEYTISRVKKITPHVEDFETLKKALEEAEIEVYTEETFSPVMDVVFKQILADGKNIDGLEGKVTEFISIRLARKEEK